MVARHRGLTHRGSRLRGDVLTTEIVAPGPDLEDRPDLIGALLVLNWDMSAGPPPTVGKEVTHPGR
jgi:hypothetical protein